MAELEKFGNFFEKTDEEQRKLNEEQQRQQEQFEQMAQEILKILKVEQEEDPVIKTLNEVFGRIEAFNDKRMYMSIMTKEIRDLEARNPEFVAETEKGFSEEEVKRYIVTAFDAIFGVLNIGKLENTLSNVLLSLKLRKKFDFSQFSGIGVYNYIRNKDSFAKFLEPDYKKKIIYGRAVNIVVETKTISFNTAVKRAIHEIKEEGYVPKLDADDQEFLEDISRIINPLIDLYIDNELEILAAIGSK